MTCLRWILHCDISTLYDVYGLRTGRQDNKRRLLAAWNSVIETHFMAGRRRWLLFVSVSIKFQMTAEGTHKEVIWKTLFKELLRSFCTKRNLPPLKYKNVYFSVSIARSLIEHKADCRLVTCCCVAATGRLSWILKRLTMRVLTPCSPAGQSNSSPPWNPAMAQKFQTPCTCTRVLTSHEQNTVQQKYSSNSLLKYLTAVKSCTVLHN